MIIYTIHRLLLWLTTLFTLSLIGFVLSYYTPHAPLRDKSLLDALQSWFSGILQYDFGFSYITGQSINLRLYELFPATLELCCFAFLIALLIGVPLGITAGVMRGRWQDKLISALALVGFSLPVFWLSLLLMLLFSLSLGWLPVSGRINLLYPMNTVTGIGLIDALLENSQWRHAIITSVLIHLILPVTTISVASMTEIIRLTRFFTCEVMAQNYIKAATIRGLSRFTVIRRHVLHNAIPPVISRLGPQFSTILTLTMITEIVFNWPGMGLWLLAAGRQQDFAVLSAGIMVMGGLIVTVNILTDILSAVLNPLKRGGE